MLVFRRKSLCPSPSSSHDAALFSPDTPDRVASSATARSSFSFAGVLAVGTPAMGNIFRFKAEVRRNAKRALFSGEDEEDVLFHGIFTTRGAGPWKILKSPYKVLIGCNGINSVVTKWLGLTNPSYSGYWHENKIFLSPNTVLN